MQPRTHSWLGGTAIALCAIAMTSMARPASAEIAYSVSETNKLVRFDTNEPGQTIVGTISGMIGGEQILSIDFRPITDRLYGVSANRLYTIDPATAQAQPVGVAAFTVPLAGNADMDFDPVSGMIRVVTDTNQNVRINPETGVDTADTPISGVIGISAIAFRKNIAPAERSTLLAISPATNVFARIGEVDLTDGGASQAAGVATATQALGFDVDGPAGFDITANSERFFAVLTRAGETESGLYTDTFQGGASLLRGVPVGERLRGLAVLSRQVTLHLLAQPGNRIVSVLSSPTATIIPITRDTPIAGLHPFEAMTQIATRPATGELVGLTTTGRLLNIDPRTGQTTFLSQLSVAVSAKVFTFHPATDRLRIIQASRENFSVDPDTGVVTAEAIIDRPTVESGAYALDGTLYVRSQGEFHRLTDPSTGVSTPMPDGAAHETDFSGLAFGPDGVGYHVYSPPGSAFSHLRYFSIPSGKPLAPIWDVPSLLPAGAASYAAAAVASPGPVRFSAANYSVLENAGEASITLMRAPGSSGPIAVHLNVTPGSATAPADFTAFESTVQFLDGETSKTLFVPIVNDVADEGGETVTLTLSQPSLGLTLGTPSAATLTIADNDPVTGAAPTVMITSPTTDPVFTASSLFITLTGAAVDTDGTIASVAWTNDRGFSGTVSIGESETGVLLEWDAPEVQLAPGVNTITVTATDNSGNLVTDTIVVTVDDLSYYLAEGATGTFFDFDLLLANPNPNPVNITVTFLPFGRQTVVRSYMLPATSRTTINVETISGLEAAEVSTIVKTSASTPIVVERTMRWDSTGYGAHTDKASPSTAAKWYFAEGSQGFFFTYLLLNNPHDVANQASVRYLREGASAVTRTYDLAPFERFTVDIGADEDLVNTSFGMEVTFLRPGIAERAMYFGLSPLWAGGHESMGVTLPSRSWILAEGATGSFFETFLLFANPSATTAEIDVRYLPASGTPVSRSYEVEPGQRRTVNIQGEDATLAAAAVATEVTSNVPIIVERAQYWPDPAPNWYEAHNSFGMTATGTRWGLAEGRAGMTGNYQTYILLANPNDEEAGVTITFLRENGMTLVKTFTVQPGNRFNVAVGVDVPEISSERFSAVITATRPIAVERAMYSDQGGVTWQAGTNAIATRLP